MKNLLIGIAVAVVVVALVALWVINVICNFQIDDTLSGTCAAICAMALYEGLTKRKDKSSEK